MTSIDMLAAFQNAVNPDDLDSPNGGTPWFGDPGEDDVSGDEGMRLAEEAEVREVPYQGKLTREFLLGLAATEWGMADAVTYLIGGNLRYAQDQGCWYGWGGQVWYQDDVRKANITKGSVHLCGEDIKAGVRDIIGEAEELEERGETLPDDMPDKKRREALTSAAALFSRQAGVSAVTADMACDRDLHMRAADLDKPEWLVVPEGVIKTGDFLDGKRELLPHDRARLVSKMCAAHYNPDAEAPLFLSILAQAIEEEAERWWLLGRSGGGLLGYQGKGFINFIGPGDSGKSTITKVIGMVMGTYARSVRVSVFQQQRDENKFAAAALRGHRFVYCGEPNKKLPLNEAFLKLVTGGDPITSEDKFEKEVTWKSQVVLCMHSNFTIRQETSDTAGLTRLEPITARVGYTEKDEHLEEKLMTESSGILNLLLDYGAKVATGEMKIPKSVEDARERAARSMSSELDYIATLIEDGFLAEDRSAPRSWCETVGDLYSMYKMHMIQDEGAKHFSGKKTFSECVGRLYPVGVSDGARFTGLVGTAKLAHLRSRSVT